MTRLSSPKGSEMVPKFIANRPSNDVIAARLIKNKRNIIQSSRPPIDKVLRSSAKVSQPASSPVANFHLDLSAIDQPKKKLKTQKSHRFIKDPS